MTNNQVIYLVAAVAGTFSFAAYAGLIAVPAWQAYTAVWQRVAAVFLSLYVLAALLGVGVIAGAGVVWFWDRLI